MKTINVKIKQEYFDLIIQGVKTFEIRLNDRDYQADDRIIMSVYEDGMFTGDWVACFIPYVFYNPDYCKEGYVIMSLPPVKSMNIHRRKKETKQ
jgi:hypothetical protein